MCNEREKLIGYLYDEGDSSERDAVRQHLETCAECRSEIGSLRSVREDLVARKEMSEAVARAMSELPEEQRIAILLKEFHGLTFQEIADQLDCPLSTVKTRLYQGLSVLRRRLERRQAEEASLRRAHWEGSST